ncbi:hypothetical protein [Schlesneria paludicola]|uniref:hypothetical protein n=1 Tax=Schlesneria paludicola TaxID=360056 RepID=UPI00029B3628|nr:hypothetical protein [Schlesneria paludicola]
MRTKTIVAQAAYCLIALTCASFSQAADITFSKDIAPIIFQNCTICHRPDEAAPFSLQNYADVQKRGELITQVVGDRSMPPWKAGHGDYAFRDERRLTNEQIALIQSWVKQGMPEGNRADLPAMPQFTPGWILGEPDLVVSMKEAFPVPAEGADIYRNFVIPLNLTSEHWVRAIDFRPSARSVVHHSLFFFDASGKARKLEEEDSLPGFKGGMGAIMRLRGGPPGGAMLIDDQGDIDKGENRLRGPANRRGAAADGASFGPLGGWALGAMPRALPDGLAFRLPAGSDLILSTHFHPSGKAEEESSTIGMYFSKEPTTRKFTGLQLPPAFGAFKGIDIPAGQKEYVIEDSFELPIAVEAFGAGAHAHYLGKSMTLSATLPNGETKILLTIPDWDFAWQGQYQFQEYVSLPKGTRLHSRITYDNSADNPRNPTDPPVRVRFGEESTDEMGSMTLFVVAATEGEIPQLIASYQEFVRKSFSQFPLLKLLQTRRVRTK